MPGVHVFFSFPFPFDFSIFQKVGTCAQFPIKINSPSKMSILMGNSF